MTSTPAAVADAVTDDVDLAPPPPDVVYPGGAVGDLMRQRDARQADAERARSCAEIFTAQADAADAIVAQLQAAIDAMPDVT